MSEEKLTETQVRIYLYVATHRGGLSVRDIARALNLSPSTVHYNLRKLEELGYIASSSNGYIVVKPVKLRDYIVFGKLIIPRLTLYGLFFTGVFAGTLVYSVINGFNNDRTLALTISLVATILFYIEAYKIRKKTLP